MKSSFVYRVVSFFLVSQMGLAQNHSLSFDGTGDHVSINGANVSKPCTAEFWVKRITDTGLQIILNNQSNFSLRLQQYNSNNKVGYTKYSSYDDYFNYVAPEGEWVHLAVVATTDSIITLFVNGEYHSENFQPFFKMPLSTIGKNGNNTLNATLDELRV